MSRVQFPCLWFDGNAEEAAELYVGVLPDSRITKVWRASAETPSGAGGHGPDGGLHGGRSAAPGAHGRRW